MNRRHAAHLAVLLGLTILVRGALFKWVGIWGDAGFYVYDARLITAGQTPFVDFIGRSPLFNYAYAHTSQVFGNQVPVLRAFIVTWWILCLFPVYYIARDIRGHRAGLAAGAVMQLSPFMLVYGYWANTQSVAALAAVSGVAAVVWREDAVGYGVAGLLLGVAFMSRRSVIVILGAICLYAAYQAYRQTAPRHAATNWAGAVSAFAATITAAYVIMAGGDLVLASKLAETHAYGLISSKGRGGFPLITDETPPYMKQQLGDGRVPFFNDVCQMCGAWTARTFAKTTLVTVPVIGPLMWYFRDWSDHLFSDRLRDYTLGVLLILSAYGAVTALTAGYLLRPLTAMTLVGFGVLAFKTEAIDRNVLYHRHMVLSGLCLIGLSAGYLYRPRHIHTYYVADFFPYLSVIVGVVAIAAWEAMEQ